MAMSDKMRSIEDMISPLMKNDEGMKIKTSPKKEEGSITAKEVEVTGAFEDEIMKMYQDAVEQGYKGSFYDFLIDRMGSEFDDESLMRVSETPEGIMQLMNMMKNKRKTV